MQEGVTEMLGKVMKPEIILCVRCNRESQELEVSILRDNIRRKRFLDLEEEMHLDGECISFDLHTSVQGINVSIEALDAKGKRMGFARGCVEYGFHFNVEDILERGSLRIALFHFYSGCGHQVNSRDVRKERWILERKAGTLALSREKKSIQRKCSHESFRGRSFQGKKALRR